MIRGTEVRQQHPLTQDTEVRQQHPLTQDTGVCQQHPLILYSNGVSSTTATSTHSPSHLIERYQKMSMQPLAEGKLRYART